MNIDTSVRFKPVWRLNSTRHPKEKIQGNAISIDGMEFDLKTSISGLAFDRRFDSKTNIYVYETTRTKASKYERVDCEYCDGTGNIVVDYCYKCNGQGHTWEKR